MTVIVNCSKRPKSNTEYFLNLLKSDIAVESKDFDRNSSFSEISEALINADSVILGIPLYVDGVPAQTVAMFEYLYEMREKIKSLRVYTLCNLGFYECIQSEILTDIVRCWCNKSGFSYSGGLVIGAGEIMSKMSFIKRHKSVNSIMDKGLVRLASAVNHNEAVEEVYAEPKYVTKNLYMFAANLSWKLSASKNGLKQRELKNRY